MYVPNIGNWPIITIRFDHPNKTANAPIGFCHSYVLLSSQKDVRKTLATTNHSTILVMFRKYCLTEVNPVTLINFRIITTAVNIASTYQINSMTPWDMFCSTPNAFRLQPFSDLLIGLGSSAATARSSAVAFFDLL